MNFLFKKIDPSYLFFFRIVFGILALIEAISIFSYLHIYKKAFQPENFQFKYYGFEWVQPLPEPFMSLFFVLLMALALAVFWGWHYRICAFLYALGFSYTYFLDATYYLNHGYLFVLLCFAMACIPAHRFYSLDVFQGRVQQWAHSPSWPLYFLRFMMAIVYIFGGIAKLNPDWLNAMPLKYWLDNKAHLFLIGPILEKDLTAYFMSYGGLALDLFVVPFLLNKKTRPWAFGFVVFFHFINLLVFEIGIFPWLSTTLTALYFAPDFPRQVWNWLSAKIKKLKETGDSWNENWAPMLQLQTDFNYSAFQKKLISGTLILFCSIQLLIPLRHHLYKGDVVWTEQGHRYAWRMMLRSKRGKGNFKVVDTQSGKEETVRSEKYLTPRQRRKLYMHPYMILQFAHFLRDEYEKKGFVDPQVYGNLTIRVNGYPYQTYVDPTRDLAREQWNPFRSVDWVTPWSREKRQ